MSKWLQFSMVAGIVLSLSLALHAELVPPFSATSVMIPYQGYLQLNGAPYSSPAEGVTITVALYDDGADSRETCR